MLRYEDVLRNDKKDSLFYVLEIECERKVDSIYSSTIRDIINEQLVKFKIDDTKIINENIMRYGDKIKIKIEYYRIDVDNNSSTRDKLIHILNELGYPEEQIKTMEEFENGSWEIELDGVEYLIPRRFTVFSLRREKEYIGSVMHKILGLKVSAYIC